MIIYTAIVSGLLVASGYAIYKLVQKHAAEVAKYQGAIDDLQTAVSEQQQEIEAAYHTIEALEEVNREANAEKRKLHRGSRGDNARAATRLMSKLAGDGDSDGDETTPKD